MTHNLTKDEILIEIDSQFFDDEDFLVQVIDENTSSMASLKAVIIRLLEIAEEREDILDIIDRFS